MYLPRSTPSMSVTATFTRVAGDARTDSMIFWCEDLVFFMRAPAAARVRYAHGLPRKPRTQCVAARAFDYAVYQALGRGGKPAAASVSSHLRKTATVGRDTAGSLHTR